MLLRCAFVWLLTLLPLLGARAQEAYLTAIPDPKTLGEGYVSDPDHLLAPATVQDLNALLGALDQSRRAHIDVVLTRSIGGAVPKVAATALFNRWKIGDAQLDNGLLLLLVDDQHRVEMETGYGLEADLPDVVCYRVQQRYMVPYLRRGQYDAAVRQGVAALIRQLRTGHIDQPDSLNPAPAPALADDPAARAAPSLAPAGRPGSWSVGSVAGVIVVLALMLVVVGMLAFRKHTPRPLRWGLGLGAALLLTLAVLTGLLGLPLPPALFMALGYLWPLLGAHVYLRLINQQLATRTKQSRHARYGFLAETHHGLGWLRFVFPLGLALYWPRYRRRLAALRDEPYACPTCAQPMHRLTEDQDDAVLPPGQATEERIHSVDYDVWQCPAGHQLVLDYANLNSDAKVCTSCHHRTAQPQPDQEVVAATTAHGGWGWHVWHCAFCQHEQKTRYTTARRSSSSSGSSSGSSGGSSSSSSGGSSGGGGAGSSW